MSNENVGVRVKKVREDAGLNQRDFAARLNVSNGAVSQVESGKTMPGGEFLLRMYQEFGTDITWLLVGVVTGNIPVQELRPDEEALLDNYRNTPKEQQKIIKETSAAFAKRPKKRSA